MEFENTKTQDGKPHPNHPFSTNVGYADTPGTHFLAGQIGWAPDFKSINGTIVFDGSLVEMCGILRDPVSLIIKEGEITKVEGGRQAMEFEDWMKSFNHPQMFKLAHATYGFNPGAILTGIGVEDERVWSFLLFFQGNFLKLDN
ncbi:2,5-dihydroxypyridine 5,6-dioxygenase [subsurface metagenome]